MYLAGLFGHAHSTGWPVSWATPNGVAQCYIHHPYSHGGLSEYMVGSSDCAAYTQVSRQYGIRLLAGIWDQFHHIGDIPTRAEIAATPPGPCDEEKLPRYDNIPYNHGDDEEQDVVSDAGRTERGDDAGVSDVHAGGPPVGDEPVTARCSEGGETSLRSGGVPKAASPRPCHAK